MHGKDEKISFLPRRGWKNSSQSAEQGFPCGKTESETDSRYHRVSPFGRKLYLPPLLDLYNGGTISCALSEWTDFEQITKMLNKAFEKVPDNSRLILHLHQGWQYQNGRYQRRLSDKGIGQSMSRKGNCLDNADKHYFFKYGGMADKHKCIGTQKPQQYHSDI